MDRGLPAAFTWDTQYSTVASGVVTVISTSTSRGSVDTFVNVGLDTRAAEEGLERELRQYAARGVNDPGCHTGELVPASDPVLGGVLLRVRRRPCTL